MLVYCGYYGNPLEEIRSSHPNCVAEIYDGTLKVLKCAAP